MEEKISIFGGKFKRVTVELILSAIVVSFLEAGALWLLGFLQVGSFGGFLSITFVLAVIEIILIILIEEALISAKTVVKGVIKKRKIRRIKK